MDAITRAYTIARNSIASNPSRGGASRSGGGIVQSPPRGGSPAPAPAPAPDYGAVFKGEYDKLVGEANKIADELIQQAQGDFDFAAKWIESAYKLARGSDQGQQAEFLKQVANVLEEKVGRIAFDYQTGTYRVNQSADLAQNRTIQGRDLVLKRLEEDEQVFRKQFADQTQQERDEQDTSLNARGIYSAPRGEQGGLAGKEIGRLESTISDRLGAYERQLGRDRFDTTEGARQDVEDIGIARTRGLEDLTTGARRGAIDADNDRNYSMEEANRTLERQKLEAEKFRRERQNVANTYADYIARGKVGAV